MLHGVVREWHVGEGWGVVDGDDLPAPCFVHVSVVDMSGFRVLAAGDHVLVAYEETVATQDGYRLRATVVRPLRLARSS